jgi:translation elongation factor EF-4
MNATWLILNLTILSIMFVSPGVYPIDQSEYNNLKSAIEKLTLNDSSVTVHRDSSLALGAGWR